MVTKPTIGQSEWGDDLNASLDELEAALAAHAADTTSVHGIADMTALATDAEVAVAVEAHRTDTTNVHGIADTAVLATDAEVASAVSAHEAAVDPHAGYLTEAAALAAYVAKADAATATVATNQTTTSLTYTDLTTIGPAVTRTIGASGRALVIPSLFLRNNTINATAFAAVAVSGATTRAASDAEAVRLVSATADASIAVSRVVLMTGLTPGSNTFTVKYRVDGGTGLFGNRDLIVIPL